MPLLAGGKMGHPLTISSDEQVPIFHLSIPLAKIACSTKLADGTHTSLEVSFAEME